MDFYPVATLPREKSKESLQKSTETAVQAWCSSLKQGRDSHAPVRQNNKHG